MSAAVLARTLHVPTDHINRNLQGRRPITAEMAMRLGYCLDTGPELWQNLQAQYELRLAEEQVGQEIRATSTPRTVDSARCQSPSSS